MVSRLDQRDPLDGTDLLEGPPVAVTVAGAARESQGLRRVERKKIHSVQMQLPNPTEPSSARGCLSAPK